MEENGSETSSSPPGPLPQQELTWLLNRDDFDERVGKDEENLCCVVVTSTLCRHSGIRRIRYPKANRVKDGDDTLFSQDENDGNGEGAEEAEDEEDEEEGSFDEDGDGEAAAKRSHFFREIQKRLIENGRTVAQRRHVRFFHICACTEEETNIAPLVAKDPTFAAYGRAPSEYEIKELHRTAYKQLADLIQSLGIISTPCLLFFLKGQPLRYSMMVDPSPANRVSVSGAKDSIMAIGSNYVKWKHVLRNATVVRNEVMKEYDETVRQKARQERREQQKRERAERRRLRVLEDQGEEDEEEDNDAGDD